MKTLVRNYIFDKTNKKITFLDYASITLDEILLITNVTDNVMIYNFANPSLGGTVSGNVLTLTYDTSSMSNTDSLQIFIDSDVQPANTDLQEEAISLLVRLLQSTAYARDANDRMRVIMDNNPILYTYTRNSGAGLTGSTEGWYSTGSWNIVDARETLTSQINANLMVSMQRWRVQ